MADQHPVNTPSSDWITGLQQAYSQVRFGPGLVGKTSRAILAVMAIWFAVACRLNDNLILNASLIFCGLLASGVFCWWATRTQKFAEKFPQTALLEGAHLIEYQKLQAEINGTPLPVSKPIPAPEISELIEEQK